MADSELSRRSASEATGLLGRDDPPAVIVTNPQGRSPFLLIGDHAGNAIPKRLGDLGVSAVDRARHIAWDIGVASLGERLAMALDAVFVRQAYSRLVIDCNRDPDSADAIPEISDGTIITGNAALDGVDRDRRIAEIHEPYQRAIAAEILRRTALGLPTLLVSLHSFTPLFGGTARPWEIGVLHDGANDALALRLLAWLEAQPSLVVGDNEPYRMDGTDHTVPRHAFPSLPYVEIELSQGRLADEPGIASWAVRLADGLRAVLAEDQASS
jgi:predicted N-formylglutamate amidohydrolase